MGNPRTEGIRSHNATDNEGGTATINTFSRDPLSRVRDQFREAVSTFDARLPPIVSQAMRSLLAAREYADEPLIRSHLETAIRAMIEVVREAIVKRLDWSQSVRTFYTRVAAEVGGSPSKEFDETGRTVAAHLDQVIQALTELREGLVREMSLEGMVTPGAKELEAEIPDMESFRASLVGGWPWSTAPLPSSDRGMLERARAETERGAGVPIEELIRKVTDEN